MLSVALGACGTTVVEGGIEPAATASEGTRLTPLAWVPEDGTTVVAAGQFHDSDFDHPCVMSLDEAGTRRCFPFDSGRFFPRDLFTGDECDEQAIPATACSERPAFLRELLSRDDGTLFERAYRETTRALNAGASFFTRAATPRLATECVAYDGELSTFLAPGRQLVAAERIPDFELAAVESVEVRPLGGGLEEREERLEDGSRTRVRAPETPCSVYATLNDGLRCVPAADLAPRSRSLFTDPSCTERAWPVPLLGSEDLLVLTSNDARPPVVETARRVTGEPRLLSVFRRNESGDCEPEGEEVVASVSNPIPLESFPALTREPRGRGRLRPLAYVDEEGREWPVFDRGLDPFRSLTSRFNPVFRDRALDIDCGAARSVNGERCFPRGTLAYFAPSLPDQQTFLDAACDDPLLQPNLLGDPPVTHVARVETVGEGCDERGAVVELRRVEPVVQGTPLWFRPRGGACTPAEPARDDIGAFRATGDPLDLTRYARFVRTPFTLP